MNDNDAFKRVKNSIIVDPEFLQLVYGFINDACFYLRPEHSDELFNELKKWFEDCPSDNYKVEWKRMDDGDDGGDYVKFTIERQLKVNRINVAKDFSDTPIGVYRGDSNYSAEAFREDILIPALKRGRVKVDLSGTCGYGASWLQGVFERLYSESQFDEEYLDNNLEIYVSNSRDNCYLDAVKRYIEEAKKFNAFRKERNSKLDEQVTKLVNAMNLVDEAYKWFLETNWDKLATEDCMTIQRRIGQLISDINDAQKLKEEQQ